MVKDFEDIVREWYARLRPAFLIRLTKQFPSLTLGDAENLYQDAFIAIYDNLREGRVRQDTSWNKYIMTIGVNLANKAMRKIGKTDTISSVPDYDDCRNTTANKVENLLNTITEDDVSLSANPEVQSLLGKELIHTPEPCASIIRHFYYGSMSMEEIAEQIGYKNAQTAKAKKNQCMQCMTDLSKRVTGSLNSAGYDIKPKKRNKNGKD